MDLVEFVRSKRKIIEIEAKKQGLVPFDLEIRLLLFLPRLVSKTGRLGPVWFENELKRLARLVKEKQTGFSKWNDSPSDLPKSIRQTDFVLIDPDTARIVHERFHYLGSFRSNSNHFALVTKRSRRIVCLGSFSDFDIARLKTRFPRGLQKKQGLLLSRFFSFRWAPKNAFSYFFGQFLRFLKKQGSPVAFVVTAVNPNLGFTGASYLSSNWVYLGKETGTYYAYLDKNYVTDRDLLGQFETFDSRILKQKLKKRFEVSNYPLEPILQFIYFVDQKDPFRKKKWNLRFARPRTTTDYLPKRTNMNL